MQTCALPFPECFIPKIRTRGNGLKVLIRADANKTVSMGHVMRCLSIADALKSMGASVLFVCAKSDAKELINKRGFDVSVLDTDFDKTIDELGKFSALIKQENPDLIICDGYYFSSLYFEEIGKYAKTVYLDDYSKDAYPVDVLINYNIYGDLTDYEGIYKKAGVKLPKLILGTGYAPLRKEFIDAKPIEIKKDAPYDVLVSTGGSDSLHIAKTVADRFVESPKEGIKLNILVGPFSSDYDYLINLEKSHPDTVKIWSNITDMPGFLANFDYAISAAGSTTYELCRMGIPSVIFSMADNQDLINETFDSKKIIKSAGNAQKHFDETISNLLHCIYTIDECYEQRVMYSDAQKKCVDGKGALRIANFLIKGEGKDEKNN